MSRVVKNLLKRLFGPSESPVTEPYIISKGVVQQIEKLLPGDILILVVKQRKFCLVEADEFDALLERAGMKRADSDEE